MFTLPRRQAPADESWDIESPRFDRSVLSGRSLKQIEGDSLKKILVALVPPFESGCARSHSR
jgi:hypothetical protein